LIFFFFGAFFACFLLFFVGRFLGAYFGVFLLKNGLFLLKSWFHYSATSRTVFLFLRSRKGGFFTPLCGVLFSLPPQAEQGAFFLADFPPFDF